MVQWIDDRQHNQSGTNRATVAILQLEDPTGPLGLGPGLAIGLLLLLLILLCVLGNLLVISAILIERDLRSRPQYYLIFSLAVADLMVGLIVTPLGAWMTLRQAWELGVTLCDFWISVDVLVCTSSILHLVAIALDRYWSVTSVYYTQNRTPRRIFTMLLCVWVFSLLISLAPNFVPNLKDKDFRKRVEQEKNCLISQDIAYQVFSTATAFYIPLCAIIFIYYKIMRAAKKRFQRERDRKTINRQLLDGIPPKATKLLTSQNPPSAPTTAKFSQSQLSQSNQNLQNSFALCPQNGHIRLKLEHSNTNQSLEADEQAQLQLAGDQPSCGAPDAAETEFTPSQDTARPRHAVGLLGFPRPLRKPKKRAQRESVEARRERKAWRTLAIITGTFIACWTPFFILSLYRPICMKITGKSHCENIPPAMEQVFNWLGYLNSALNPIIYTIFSMDFRLAFERILKRIFMFPSR